jgi:rhodanese-related sulfurtransferase
MPTTTLGGPIVDPAEAHERAPEIQLLDVRETGEWVAGHIEGAVHVPMGELADRRTELAEDRPIVAVCRSGARSGQVTAALRRAGYDAHNLDGGMQAWAAADLPYVSEGPEPPRIA